MWHLRLSDTSSLLLCTVLPVGRRTINLSKRLVLDAMASKVTSPSQSKVGAAVQPTYQALKAQGTANGHRPVSGGEESAAAKKGWRLLLQPNRKLIALKFLILFFYGGVAALYPYLVSYDIGLFKLPA